MKHNNICYVVDLLVETEQFGGVKTEKASSCLSDTSSTRTTMPKFLSRAECQAETAVFTFSLTHPSNDLATMMESTIFTFSAAQRVK